jgi:hypothetical protein
MQVAEIEGGPHGCSAGPADAPRRECIAASSCAARSSPGSAFRAPRPLLRRAAAPRGSRRARPSPLRRAVGGRSTPTIRRSRATCRSSAEPRCASTSGATIWRATCWRRSSDAIGRTTFACRWRASCTWRRPSRACDSPTRTSTSSFRRSTPSADWSTPRCSCRSTTTTCRTCATSGPSFGEVRIRSTTKASATRSPTPPTRAGSAGEGTWWLRATRRTPRTIRSGCCGILDTEDGPASTTVIERRWRSASCTEARPIWGARGPPHFGARPTT